MLRFGGRSIAHKLIFLFTAVAAFSVAAAFLAFWLREIATSRYDMEREVGMITKFIGRDGNAPGEVTNERTMSILRDDSRITEACIFDVSGLLVRSYQRASRLKPAINCAALSPVTGGNKESLTALLLRYPLRAPNGATSGYVIFRISMEEMYRQMLGDLVIGLIVLGLTLLLVSKLSNRLQRIISNPIRYLTQVAGRVSKDGDYAIRAIQWSEDEMGILTSQFNRMMEQIYQRDCELSQVRQELESRVERRTIALQSEIAERRSVEQELRVAKLAAEEANRSKSDFLASMSHELRTPLNAVIGYSEMLEEDAQASSQFAMVTDLRHIQTAGRKLLSLIDDILDISKIEAGHCDLQMELVAVDRVLQEVLTVVQPLIRKNRNQFVLAVEPGLAPVYIDPVKFHQCLLNLISNACKFTQAGTVTLEVCSSSPEPNSLRPGESFWRVKDTGIGIAEQDRSKLFKAFSQVDASVTRKHGGTGLGLAISQQLCRQMGGGITVESNPGQGSCFTIQLPSRKTQVESSELVTEKQ